MAVYTQKIDGCFTNVIGNAGIAESDFKNIKDLLAPHVHALLEEAESGGLPLLTIADTTSDLDEIERTAKAMRSKFETLVVLGTGGSILNPESLCALRRNIGDKKLFFANTVDPIVFENRLADLDLKKTAFLSISKSGSTLETISQTMICLEISKGALGDDFSNHWFFITDPYENPIRNLAKEIGAKTIDHPEKIGGRYSGLTAVGLLPAAFAGLNVGAVRKGAAFIMKDLKENRENSMSAESAALYYGFFQKKTLMSVMLPYIARLSDFTTWYSQIVAESLGKDGQGITPVRAIGPLDQHSQLQLFLDGPHDKWITLITQSDHEAKHTIRNDYVSMKQFNYLEGKTLADVLCAEQQGTIETLKNNGRPLRHISIKSLDEKTIGALMMQMMLEVVLMGRLMDINPFDQPAVEQGKVRTRELLSAF